MDAGGATEGEGMTLTGTQTGVRVGGMGIDWAVIAVVDGRGIGLAVNFPVEGIYEKGAATPIGLGPIVIEWVIGDMEEDTDAGCF